MALRQAISSVLCPCREIGNLEISFDILVSMSEVMVIFTLVSDFFYSNLKAVFKTSKIYITLLPEAWSLWLYIYLLAVFSGMLFYDWNRFILLIKGLCFIVFFVLFYRSGFEKAFSLLNNNPRTGCQSVIIFATDGKDTDGENVRCGPGNANVKDYNH